MAIVEKTTRTSVCHPPQSKLRLWNRASPVGKSQLEREPIPMTVENLTRER
jgi:hypothetical protein